MAVRDAIGIRTEGSGVNTAEAIAPSVVGIPVSHATPSECVCPACHIFEREPGAAMCPRCTVRAANRAAKNDEQRRHDEAIAREREAADKHELFLESLSAQELDAYYRSERARQACVDAGID